MAHGHARQGAVGCGGAGVGRERQALGDRGVHLERPAGARRRRGLARPRSRRSSGRAWRPARRSSATPARIDPANWVGGLASPDLHAIVILFARDAAERERCTVEHETLVAQCEGVERALLPRPRGHAALRVRPRPLRLSRPAVAARHRRNGRDADPRLRRAAQAGRVHPRLPRRGRPARQSAAARGPLPQRQLHGLSPHGGARRRVPRLPAAARPDARGAGAPRGEADGALAQRRSARPGAREGRPGARRRPAAQQRFQLQGDGPARLRGAARLAHPAHEPPRHGAQHEPPPDDPARRHVRPAPARGRRKTTASSAASRPS